MINFLKVFRKSISLLLLFCFSVMAFLPNVAMAKDDSDKEQSKKSESTMVEVVAKYVNAIGGTEIINPDEYSVDKQEQDPQKIEGWIYDDYEESVEYVYIPDDVQYIVGYPDKTVRPLRWISRCEATAVFSRLYDGNYPKKVKKYKKDTFKDVPENHWAYDDIVAMYESGIISGDNGKFHPDQPISRAELAALAVRFNPDKFTEDKDGKSPFRDVKDGKWYSNVVQLAAANEWVHGYPDKTFRPEESVTRTETMAVINRVLQRQITTERLEEVGATNPYTDIKASDWYYADAIEATVKHDTEKWHEPDFNGGKYNVIEQDFVDKDGNVLAEHKQVKGKQVKAPKDIPGFKYLGYVKHAKFTYKKGTPRPSITKTSDGEGENAKTFLPSDIVTYKVVVKNDKKATRWMENAVVTDNIPENVTYQEGSVTIDGKQAKDVSLHRNDDKKVDKIKVELGKVGIGKEKVVVFACKINEDTYTQEVKNVAFVKADNMKDELKAEDKGFVILDGKAVLEVEKHVTVKGRDDLEAVKVGDEVTYNIAVKTNKEKSDTKARNVVFKDTIDPNLEFKDGVRVNNKSADSEYNEDTRELKVELGDIKCGETVNITFKAKIAPEAFKQKIENVAIAQGENTDEASANAETIITQQGAADIKITKEAVDKDKKPIRGKLKVGDDLLYVIKVTNNDNAETVAHDVHVKDKIPEDYVYVKTILNGEERSAKYDPETKLLDVNVGGLDKGETAEIILYGTVGPKAYGKTITNVAVAKAENDKDGDKTPQVNVDVEKGKPDRNPVVKTVNKGEANVGEIVTYTIEASNGHAATDDWTITIEDPIPEGMTFKGNVRIGNSNADGKTYSYNSETKTLTLTPPPIPKDHKVTYKFDVQIDKGMEGKTFTNKCTVKEDGQDDSEVVCTPVHVPLALARPSITKTADTKSVKNLETFKYTVTVRNEQGGATWHNVILEDELPPELTMVGSPSVVGGNPQSSDYYVTSGNVHSIILGDIESGDQRVVTYEVQVKADTQKNIELKSNLTDEQKDKIRKDNSIQLVNRVVAHGDNGTRMTDDSKVIILPIEEEKDVPPDVDVTDPLLDLTVEKQTEHDTINLKGWPDNGVGMNTYTIKVTNSGELDANNIHVTDKLDTGRLTFVYDSVRLDGIPLTYANDFKYDYHSDPQAYMHTLDVPIGDLKVGESKTITFKVEFAPDHADNPYSNQAFAIVDGKDKFNSNIVTTTFSDIPNLTKQHEALFAGYAGVSQALGKEGDWWPVLDGKTIPNDGTPWYGRWGGKEYKYLSLQEAAAVICRSLTPEARGALLGGKTIADARNQGDQCLSDVNWNSKGNHPSHNPTDFKKRWRTDGEFNKPFNPFYPYGTSKVWYTNDIAFMDYIGALTENEYNGENDKYTMMGESYKLYCTDAQIEKMLKKCKLIPENGHYGNGNNMINRADFAKQMCAILHRDISPTWNKQDPECRPNTFPDDKGWYENIIHVTSVYNEYLISETNRHEMYIRTDPSRNTPKWDD